MHLLQSYVLWFGCFHLLRLSTPLWLRRGATSPAECCSWEGLRLGNSPSWERRRKTMTLGTASIRDYKAGKQRGNATTRRADAYPCSFDLQSSPPNAEAGVANRSRRLCWSMPFPFTPLMTLTPRFSLVSSILRYLS